MRQLLLFRTHYFISQINKTRNHRRGTTNDIFIYQRHIVYFRMMDRKIIFSISHIKIDWDFFSEFKGQKDASSNGILCNSDVNRRLSENNFILL